MKRNYIWLLFVILFLTSFDMNAQMPLLSPYAASLGASALLIGVLLGAYSTSNLVGNVVAGPFLDRYSKKMFIVCGLFLSGCLLFAHAYVDEAKDLLSLRFIYGFVMAFVTPACFALLGQIGQSGEEQGKIMAKNGIGLTAAAITAPLVSGLMASMYGYAKSFLVFGMIMLISGIVAMLFVPSNDTFTDKNERSQQRGLLQGVSGPMDTLFAVVRMKSLFPAYIAGLTLMYVQGTILYEIPLWVHRQNWEPAITGMLFAAKGMGSFLVLTQFWVHRISALLRVVIGLFLLGLVCYTIAIGYEVSLYVLLFVSGACYGLLFPAMTTILTENASKGMYGSAFSLFSAVLSVGAMVSPMIAGLCKNMHISFFLAFLTVTLGSLFCLLFFKRKNRASHPVHVG